MNFIELENIMNKVGINSLADIARYLKTTPQAVSNWKSRDQIPYHIVNMVRKINIDRTDISEVNILKQSALMDKESITFSDILMVIAEQLKVLLFIPFISITT